MTESKITTRQAIALILTILIAHSVLCLPSSIIEVTSVASLINIFYLTIIVLIYIYIVYKLFRAFPGSDILDICEYTFGSFWKKFFGFIFIAGFIISSSLLLRNFCECLKVIYYPMTDVFFVILFFIIAISITNKFNFNSTLKANLIITPIAIISIILLFFLNLEKFNIERIFPILGKGFYNTFILGFTNIFCFSGISFLYFLPPLLKEPEKFKKICLSSVLFSGAYLLITLAIIIFLFPIFYNTHEIMPLYTAARYIEFGTFFQRLESVFLLIWIFVFTCYLSITTKFSILIFKKITNIKQSNYLVHPFSLLLLGVALLPRNYAILTNIENNFNKYMIIVLVFILSSIILVLGNIKKKYIR